MIVQDGGMSSPEENGFGVFDIQNQKFTAVTCTNCGYTELFKVQGGGIGNFFDFLSG